MKKIPLFSFIFLMITSLFSLENSTPSNSSVASDQTSAVAPTDNDLYDFAHQMTAHFEDGFQWKDVVSMIRDSHYYLLDHYNQTPDARRESVKTILDHVIDITDTPYLPDALTDPIFKGMVHPFVDMMVPLSSQPPLAENPGTPDHDALVHHTHLLVAEYEGGFHGDDLGHVVEYSLNVADSYTEATTAERSAFANELINCVIDETNTVCMPDYFVDWIFKSISSSMVDHHFETKGIGTSPGEGNGGTNPTPAQDLDSAQKYLDSLENLFREKNYDAMTAEAWNLRAAAQGFQADYDNRTIGDSFFADMDGISTGMLNDLQAKTYDGLPKLFDMAQNRITVEVKAANDLVLAQQYQDTLVKLFQEKNYTDMEANAWNLRAAAEGYQADRQYSDIGKAFFADMDGITSSMINNLQAKTYDGLPSLLKMAQDRINKEK